MKEQPIYRHENGNLFTLNEDGVLVWSLNPLIGETGILTWHVLEDHEGPQAKEIVEKLLAALDS